MVIFAGMGGSLASTSAWIKTGPDVDKAVSRTAPHSDAFPIVKPEPPQARAKVAKSIGCNSQPYSGLPRKTICSHFIWPRVLFLITITLIAHVKNAHRYMELGFDHLIF